jgi:hypothetical protein
LKKHQKNFFLIRVDLSKAGMDQTKIVIESLLTGSQFEVVVNENDKILMVKTNIQKISGESDDGTLIRNWDGNFFQSSAGCFLQPLPPRHKQFKRYLVPKIEFQDPSKK